MLKIVKELTKREGRELTIVVRTDSVAENPNALTEIHSLGAKNLAYDARVDFGFADAGISATTSPYPVDLQNPEVPIETQTAGQKLNEPENQGRLAYQREFRFTRAV